MINELKIKDGLYSGFPVFIGYFPIAVTFGLLSRSADISCLESFCFSAFVFAGASQFVGLNLLQAGIGAGQITLTVFLMNFRHFLMSSALSSKTNFSKFLIPLISFGVTDETFAIASIKKEKLSNGFILALNFTAYAGWVSGTATGYVAGNFIPESVQSAISICLYALFVAILVPEIKKTVIAGIIAAVAAASNSIFMSLGFFTPGWNIIISILIASMSGFFLFNKGEQ